jgi:hypothetical protein
MLRRGSTTLAENHGAVNDRPESVGGNANHFVDAVLQQLLA